MLRRGRGFYLRVLSVFIGVFLKVFLGSMVEIGVDRIRIRLEWGKLGARLFYYFIGEIVLVLKRIVDLGVEKSECT